MRHGESPVRPGIQRHLGYLKQLLIIPLLPSNDQCLALEPRVIA